MVGVAGIGPATSSLSGTRSNQLSYTPGCDDGGGNGIRTRDFQLAKLALYQLSYAPGRLHRPAAGEPRFPRFAGRSGKANTTWPVSAKAVIRAPSGARPPRLRGGRLSVSLEGRTFRPSSGILLRKEVIQPLVPQRLPCYDFIPVTNRTLDAYLPRGSDQRLRVQSAPMM